MRHAAFLPAFLLVALAADLAAGNVVINEIHYDPPDKTRLEEFIELTNTGPVDVNLSGWFFSGGIRYTFPEGTTLPVDGYIIVTENPDSWAGRFPGEPLGPFDGFLSNDGEKIVLRSADGAIEDEVDYKVAFPWPLGSGGRGSSMELIHPLLDNNLGGSWRASTGSRSLPEEPATLIPAQDMGWHYRKGTSEASDPVTAWRGLDFAEDGTWLVGQTSIGYGDEDDNTVLDDMQGGYSSVFLRHTFTLDAQAEIPPALKIRMYVDDGCAVYVNGVEVARFHLPPNEEQPFDGRAYGHEAKPDAWEEAIVLDARGFLRPGENVLAIHALNQTFRSNDFSIDAELLIPSRDELPPAPSPGEQNTVFSLNAPPQIRQVHHFPQQPVSGQQFLVSAKVTDPEGVQSVTLRYQVVQPGKYIPAYLPLPHAVLMARPTQPRDPNPDFEDPANWTEVSLADDGGGFDEIAGDAVYTGAIPPQDNRTIVRYRITVSDIHGASVRVPYPDDRSLNFACFVYDGVPAYRATRASVHPDGAGHVYDPEVLTSIPVYWLITKAQDLSEAIAYNSAFQIPKSNEGARDAFNWEGAFVYEGIAYDHVRYRLRQANDRYGGSGKRSLRIRFNKGSYLEARDNYGRKYPARWRTLNTGKMFDNKRVGNFGITETLNSILWNMTGVPSPWMHTFHFRVVDGPDEVPAGTLGQYYGDFWGMFLAMEDYDPRFLEAHGLPDGNLYKLKDGLFNGNLFKRNQGRYATTTDEDFQNIRKNLRPTRPAVWLDQNVRYDRWYPYHTVVEAIRHYDFRPSDTHSKNRAWYFEPAEGTEFGLLWTLPYDSDASWGPNWNNGVDYSAQAIASGVDKAPFRQEYRNTIREFRDLLWREDVINSMIDELAAFVAEFSMADRDRWRNAPADAGRQDFGSLETKVRDMKNFAFHGWSGSTGPTVPAGGRAAYLDLLSRAGGDATRIPDTPVVTAVTPGSFPLDELVFETSAFSDPDGEDTFASLKWRVGEVQGATPRNPNEPPLYEWNAVWESGEVPEFAGRITVPATALEVGHTYRIRVRMMDATGRTSHWSDPVEFTTSTPNGTIAGLEGLRITEVMFHPAGDEQLEFLELQNTADAPIDLEPIRFTGGVDFAFGEGAVTSLAPGEFAVVVRNEQIFSLHYGAEGIPIAGEYSGRLDNGGEEITLSYGRMPILTFTYADSWYPQVDGAGRSLVPVAAGAPAGEWSRPENWRPSAEIGGSPGRADGETPAGGFVLPGDITMDGKLDLTDATETLAHLFLGTHPELPCEKGSSDGTADTKLLDLNGDGKLNLADPVYALIHLFQGGPPPVLGTECIQIAGCPDVCAP